MNRHQTAISDSRGTPQLRVRGLCHVATRWPFSTLPTRPDALPGPSARRSRTTLLQAHRGGIMSRPQRVTQDLPPSHTQHCSQLAQSQPLCSSMFLPRILQGNILKTTLNVILFLKLLCGTGKKKLNYRFLTLFLGHFS